MPYLDSTQNFKQNEKKDDQNPTIFKHFTAFLAFLAFFWPKNNVMCRSNILSCIPPPGMGGDFTQVKSVKSPPLGVGQERGGDAWHYIWITHSILFRSKKAKNAKNAVKCLKMVGFWSSFFSFCSEFYVELKSDALNINRVHFLWWFNFGWFFQIVFALF